jgi:hypothetical protein
MKDIIRLVIGVSVLFGSFVPVGSIAKSTTRGTDRYSIGGVRIGSTESQVYRRLGKPMSYKEDRGGCGIDFSKVLTFSAGKVWLAKSGNEPFTVMLMSVQNRNWKTERGIRVGDSISQAKKYYKFNFDSYNNAWIASSREAGSLTFKTNKANKIVDITLFADYC